MMVSNSRRYIPVFKATGPAVLENFLRFLTYMGMAAILIITGRLFWVKQPFDIVFQSISGRLPEREKERRKDR